MNVMNNQAQGKMLEKYAINLNERAEKGKLDPLSDETTRSGEFSRF